MRERWTDDRMDDLNGKVDGLRVEMKTEFATVRGEMKEEFATVRGEMRAGFDKIDKRFDKADERFERMNDRFDAMQRLMLQLGGVFGAALIGLIATQL